VRLLNVRRASAPVALQLRSRCGVVHHHRPLPSNNRQVPAPVPEPPPASAPEALRALWPWVQRFGYSDDAERESALASASHEELAELIAAIDRSVFQEINNYLDQTDNSEEAVPYGDLAQAAMEAAILLKDGG
jgi:hypothetical protein